MCVDGERVSLSQSVAELAEDGDDGVIFFDVFSSHHGGGRSKEVKLLRFTEDDLFKLAETYSKQSLPDNKTFRNILINHFKPQDLPHFKKKKEENNWSKGESLRRSRGVDRALQEYGMSESIASLEHPQTEGGAPSREAIPCPDGCRCNSSNECQRLPNNPFLPPGVTPLTRSDDKQASKSSSSRQSTPNKEMITPLMFDESSNDATRSRQSPLEQTAPHHPTVTVGKESATPRMTDTSVNNALQVL